MLLNKKQKKYVFGYIFSKENLVRIFETTDLDYLCSRKVSLGKADNMGWIPLIVDGEQVTLLNFPLNPGWKETLDHIDDYEPCQWCEEWLPKDELVKQRRGFTRLCRQCRDYLTSVEGRRY